MARRKSHGKPLPKIAFAVLEEGTFLDGRFTVTYEPSEGIDKGFTYPMLVKLYRAGCNVVASVRNGKNQPDSVYDASTEDGVTVWVPRVQPIREVAPPNGTESRP